MFEVWWTLLNLVKQKNPMYTDLTKKENAAVPKKKKK